MVYDPLDGDGTWYDLSVNGPNTHMHTHACCLFTEYTACFFIFIMPLFMNLTLYFRGQSNPCSGSTPLSSFTHLLLREY